MSIYASFPNEQPSLLLDFANAKQLPPSVTFTRATTATYYDNSTTALAEQNLQEYSQAFDGWSVNLCTATADTTTAPDGTSTADTVAMTTSSGEHYIYRSAVNCTAGVVTTVSVYAKNVNQNYIQFGVSSNGALYANFDLSTGAVGSSLGVTSTSITSVGSGWYRCVATFTPAASGFFFIGFINSSSAGRLGIYTPASATSVYLWGAQVEQRSSATAYTATTTATVTNYIPVLMTAGGGQPRFNHNPTTRESLGLQVEAAATNLQTYSATGYGWASYLSATWDSSAAVAPNGQIQAANVTFPSGSQMYMYSSSFGSSGISVTASAYMKYISGAGIVAVGLYDNTQGNKYVYFDLINGTISSSDSGATGTITSVGNGWYRCTTTKTVQNASGGMSIYASGASNVYTWGAQLEVGAVATSYIPTTSAAATRAADLAQMTNENFTSWFNQNQGTMLAYSSTNATNTQVAPFVIEAASPARIRLSYTAAQYAYALYQNVGGSFVSIQTYLGTAVGSFGYCALTYTSTQLNISDNGLAQTAGSVTFTPTPMTYATFGNSPTDGSVMYLQGHIKKIAYYPIALSQAQVQALTLIA